MRGWIGAAVWTLLAGALFWWLLSRPDTDDYAAWIPVVLVVELPAFLALRSARAGEPFGRGRATALALPLALTCSFAGLLAGAAVGFHFWKDAFLEFRPFFVGCGVAFAVFSASLASFLVSLVRRFHPFGARRVIVRATVVSLVGAGTMIGALLLGLRPVNGGGLIITLLPVYGMAPLWAFVVVT